MRYQEKRGDMKGKKSRNGYRVFATGCGGERTGLEGGYRSKKG